LESEHHEEEEKKEKTGTTEESGVNVQLSEERKGDTPLGYSGQTALKREQCNGFAQSVSRQHLCKHIPLITQQ
jgi:hypothetical protein